MHILFIEDEAKIANFVNAGLREYGFVVDYCDNGDQGYFERFHRGDPARTRKVEGTGLGLSLSREIARAHGGELTLDSTPSDQTAFTLTLPLETKQQEGQAEM